MASTAYIGACVSCQFLIHNHKMELAINVIVKHYWKQNYKAAAAARKIYEVEGEVVVSERVAQRWFQYLTLEKNTLKIYRVLEDLLMEYREYMQC